MTITSASQMDEITWTRAQDQDGDVNPAGGWYTDVTVKTVSNGDTYVALTNMDGDVELYTYNETTCQLTQVATHTGSNPTSNLHHLDMNDPQIMEVDGKIAIVGGDEAGNLLAYTYDPANPPANPTNGLHEETNFQTGTFGSGLDETFQFTASNGENYFLSSQSNGAYDGGQVTTNASGDLIFDQHVVSSSDYNSDTENGHVLVSEVRTTTHTENFNVTAGGRSVSYEQIGDTVYEYVGGPGSAGTSSMHVIKWEVNPTTGELSGSQVLYEDGTTLDDLAAAGHSTQPYPNVSPFDSTSAPLDGTYLNDIAGLPIGAGGLDMTDIRAVETFTVAGDTYMFVGTWGGQQDGAGIFKIDPNTGLPSEFLGKVDGEISTAIGTFGAGDEHFSFSGSFTDITIQTIDATGEIVISAVGQSSIIHFGFDPNATPNGTVSGGGALSYIGTEGGDKYNTYNKDTDGTNFLGYSGASDNQSHLNGYEVLPGGKVIAINDKGAWIADPGASALPCFVQGTRILTNRGEVAIEDLKIGDQVATLDNKYQEIRWIGSRTCSAVGKMAPILIRANAMGNVRDLRVSSQHRMLVQGWKAELLFGDDAVLVAAKHLINDSTVIRVEGGHVEYLHILFDQHEIIYAEGALSESFYIGSETKNLLSSEQADEILTIFPELEERFEMRSQSSHRTLKKHEAEVLSTDADFLVI